MQAMAMGTTAMVTSARAMDCELPCFALFRCGYKTGEN